jgi:hypothetical protein
MTIIALVLIRPIVCTYRTKLQMDIDKQTIVTLESRAARVKRYSVS